MTVTATQITQNEVRRIPPRPPKILMGNSKACEYPIAFQLFPVTQYRRNSVNTQTNGAARKAHEPNLRSKTYNMPANNAGNTPTISATKTIPEYASHGGNPA